MLQFFIILLIISIAEVVGGVVLLACSSLVSLFEAPPLSHSLFIPLRFLSACKFLSYSRASLNYRGLFPVHYIHGLNDSWIALGWMRRFSLCAIYYIRNLKLKHFICKAVYLHIYVFYFVECIIITAFHISYAKKVGKSIQKVEYKTGSN